MKNKTVKLVLALILLGVLVGGYIGLKSYTASQEAKETAAEEKEKNTNVFHTETDDIISLKFMIDKQEVTFVREDGTWIKEDEKEFPVNQEVLDGAASYISTVDAERVLEDVEDLTEYGLDSPSNTITITTKDNQETVLRVGIENESTSQYYVRKDDDKSTVYVVAESLISPFIDSLYDYAEMQDFPTIEPSNVYKVSVDQNENSYQAVKNSDTSLWSINSENHENEKADSSKLSSLTSSLSTLEFDSFVDYNCTDKAEYGLDQTYATVTIDYTEEEKVEEEENSSDESEDEPETITVDKEIIFFIGNETDSDSRYVMIEGSNEVYTMTKDLLSTVIDKNVSEMWDMTVSYVVLDSLDSLDVETDGEDFTINVSRETSIAEDDDSLGEDKDNSINASIEETESDDTDDDNSDFSEDSSDEGETVVTYKMNGEEVDSLDFSAFYNKLINMAGQKRLTEDYHPEVKPEMTVVFHKSDGISVNVDFYEYDVNYYAAVVDNDKAYLVNKMTFRELKSAFNELTGEEE